LKRHSRPYRLQVRRRSDDYVGGFGFVDHDGTSVGTEPDGQGLELMRSGGYLDCDVPVVRESADLHAIDEDDDGLSPPEAARWA
jgi:hypothetical protein